MQILIIILNNQYYLREEDKEFLRENNFEEFVSMNRNRTSEFII